MNRKAELSKGYTFKKGLVSKTCKEPLLNSKRTNYYLKRGKSFNIHFAKGSIQLANKQMKISLVIKEAQL